VIALARRTVSGPHLEYGVLVGGQVCMVDSSDVVPTGEVLTRDALYDGSSVRVRPQRYPGGGNLA